MFRARVLHHTHVLGEAQGYHPLYVKCEKAVDEVSKNETWRQTTAWTPTPRELELLNAGCSIQVVILADRHPPIKVQVGPCPDEKL